jgi:hypothetical protein
MSSLIPEDRQDGIQLAMLGMVEGNGHPYSWSAMFNGYDEEKMLACPYAVINDYLSKEPKDTLQIEGANVTHIWTDDPKDAEIISDTCFIPNVVSDPTDVIGEVDAVIISTMMAEGMWTACGRLLRRDYLCSLTSRWRIMRRISVSFAIG